MFVVWGVHYTSCSGVTLQSQREDPDAIYGTVDDDVYVTVGDTGQSYYSMVCHCLHAWVCMHACVRTCVSACVCLSVCGISACTIGNSYVSGSTWILHTFNCVHHMHSHLLCTSNPCEASLVYVCGWCKFFIIVTGAIVRTVILYILVYVSFE